MKPFWNPEQHHKSQRHPARDPFANAAAEIWGRIERKAHHDKNHHSAKLGKALLASEMTDQNKLAFLPSGSNFGRKCGRCTSEVHSIPVNRFGIPFEKIKYFTASLKDLASPVQLTVAFRRSKLPGIVERDELGRVKDVVYPDGGGRSFEYDKSGRLSKITDDLGKRGKTTYSLELDPEQGFQRWNVQCGPKTSVIDANIDVDESGKVTMHRRVKFPTGIPFGRRGFGFDRTELTPNGDVLVKTIKPWEILKPRRHPVPLPIPLMPAYLYENSRPGPKPPPPEPS